jgi:hypothetical protein
VGSQTNEKRKIVGQGSSHTRSLKTRRGKNKVWNGGEIYEELKKENLREAGVCVGPDSDAKGNLKDPQIRKQERKKNKKSITPFAWALVLHSIDCDTLEPSYRFIREIHVPPINQNKLIRGSSLGVIKTGTDLSCQTYMPGVPAESNV